MNELLKIAGVLCLCGYVTGVITYITPVEQMGKSLRLVIIFYIISLAINNDYPDVSFDDIYIPDMKDMTIESENYVIDMAGFEVENIVTERLNQKNISYTAVDVHINKETDKVYIEKIYVYGLKDGDASTVKELLSDVAPRESIIPGEIYGTE